MRKSHCGILVVIAFISGCSTSQDEFNSAPVKVVQEFVISGLADTTITGQQGTVIYIPKGCIGRVDQPIPVDTVFLELEEYYSKGEMLAAGLTTVSDGRLLVSSGMINIRAMDRNGKILRVIDSMYFEVRFSTFDSLDFVMPFLGEMGVDSALNWKESDLLEVSGEVIERVQQSPGTSDLVVRSFRMGSLLFKSKAFGWINADQFYNDTSPKRDIYVRVNDSSKETKSYLFLNNVVLLVPGVCTESGLFLFKGIPDSVSATVFALHRTGNQMTFGATVVSPMDTLEILTRRVTRSELDSIFHTL